MKRVFETATNRYTAEDEALGQGGAGFVYRVRDDDGQVFALKYLNTSELAKRRRFKQELSFCQQEHHPNIIRVLDSGITFGEKEPRPFYVMPKYDHDLRKLIEQGIAPDRVLLLLDQVLSGLEAAHLKGVIHRDLKPENILYDHKADRLVIADFGIAHFEEDDLITAVQTKDHDRLANFVYAAPEQRIRGEKVGLQADIFAVGLILNEMFTRTPPLAIGYPLIGAVAPQFAYLDQLVGKMIRHCPSDRPASIAKVKEEIAARGNAFVAFQRLDAAKQVVPAFSSDDPLLGQDVKVVQAAYEPQNLIVSIEPNPPGQWVEAFRNLRSYPCFGGFSEPVTVKFLPNGKAHVPAKPELAKKILEMFKQWVDSANREYREKLQRDAKQREAEHRRQIAEALRRAEEVARVNQDLLTML